MKKRCDIGEALSVVIDDLLARFIKFVKWWTVGRVALWWKPRFNTRGVVTYMCEACAEMGSAIEAGRVQRCR